MYFDLQKNSEICYNKFMSKIYDNAQKKQTAVMCYACFNSHEDIDMKMSELKSLIKANNIDVVGMIVQNIKKPDLSYLIGTGKLEELKQQVDVTSADMVIFQNELSGSKINNLEQFLNVKVIDRTMLILDIFAERAQSREGKLQVELAQLKYSLPRLAGLKASNNRYGGGVGMRGPGETKLELDRRKVENQILSKQKELDIVKANRDLRRKQRIETGQKTVALVGYTNSGKSTLMNVITKSDVFVKDMLFATLDTTTRKVFLNENLTILLSDTVGFVSDLNHELVDAFKSTLEESLTADLLLNIVDISDPEAFKKEQITKDVLAELGVDLSKVKTVYNKIDKIHQVPVNDCLQISAKQNVNIDKLKNLIIDYFQNGCNKN